MWTDLGHGEVDDSELTSGRFQGEVNAGARGNKRS